MNLVISGGEDTFALPDVVDEKEETARRTLEQMGLTVTSRTEYSSDVEEGHVISTNPAAGQQVSKAVTVELVVSRGAETVDVPDVSGMTESQARSALQGAGFQVSSSTEQSSSVQEGHVIRYNPTGKADKGSTVTIVVSSGTPEKQIPSVTGSSLESAQQQLANAGFSYSISRYEYSSSVPANCIISYSPSGSADPNSTTIFLVVSNGPKPDNPPSSSESESGSESNQPDTSESNDNSGTEAGQASSDAGLFSFH